ncbi:MAG: MoxR family ATPase [Nitrososphaerota archaeon]|nr:MoxR family ATPase [Nitrososphaerota archaeon]
MSASEYIDSLVRKLGDAGYVADRDIVVPLYLSLKLKKPLLLEGDPGCGKTELAKALSSVFGVELIRLQCYEGLDASSAIYEWNYQKQMIAIRLAERKKSTAKQVEKQIFSQEFLLPRPLLSTVLACNLAPKKKGHDELVPPAILLIDEVDRADEEFEGLLLEFLGEFQVTVPEIGTFRAKASPLVIITSNRTRDLGDGLRRRCIYSYVSYPTKEREMEIVSKKVPTSSNRLQTEVVSFVEDVRNENQIFKKPGISETIDWANAIISLGVDQIGEKKILNNDLVGETISVLLKDPEDLKKFNSEKIHRVLSKL